MPPLPLSTRQRAGGRGARGGTGEAPGPRTGKQGMTLEEIWRYRVFVREPGSATRRTVEAYCLGRGLPCPEGVQLGSVEAIKRSVIAGLGVSYFSELTVRDELARGELVRLAVEGFRVRRTFFEVRLRAKRPAPALERFLRFTRAYRSEG
ncbi:LysR substrate-binding domain-containing protein [Deferrisoma camini]|uniref:LysR substrate-binding domain-containing protein n=1 Tax=Deferrisoma camini TaxID=1035120 RepID=UPI002480E695|nr:LysR substrate-binding domain-containing protein [Deferrisoma camini]